MKKRDWVQISISSIALAIAVAFNSCSGPNSPTLTDHANATVESLPPLPTGGLDDSRNPSLLPTTR